MLLADACDLPSHRLGQLDVLGLDYSLATISNGKEGRRKVRRFEAPSY
jgi:hypothetical protein